MDDEYVPPTEEIIINGSQVDNALFSGDPLDDQ